MNTRVIVQHKESKKKFLLLGTGFGSFKSAKDGVLSGFFTNLEGDNAMLCICDARGEIFWVESYEFDVLSVGGQPLTTLAGEIGIDSLPREGEE